MGLTPSSLKRAAAKSASNNPDPGRFTVLKVEQAGRHCVARVNYPDATNFEGVKVLLYLDTNLEDVLLAKRLDPHFAESGNPPFARFEPTDTGWLAATFLASALNDRAENAIEPVRDQRKATEGPLA